MLPSPGHAGTKKSTQLFYHPDFKAQRAAVKKPGYTRRSCNYTESILYFDTNKAIPLLLRIVNRLFHSLLQSWTGLFMR